MQLRYMGFEQAKAVRVYRFDRIEERVPTVRYTVTADLALFLCSDAAAYITGAVCVCDGGQSLLGSRNFLGLAAGIIS